MTTLLDLDTLQLASGGHRSPEAGACLMEAVSMFAKEPFSDHPTCVSPYLRSFGIRLNDRATDEQRQDLVQFIPRVVGTAGDGLDDQRRWLAADHIAHVSVPRWLDAAGLTEHAANLRGLPTITSREEWWAARDVIQVARDLAYELRRARWEPIRKAVREAVEKTLAERPAVAVAVAAAADAAAAAAADADAAVDVAVAAAAAADAAAAAAVAAAVAVDADAAAAAAVAAAVAVAADAAVDVAADARYWTIRNKVYDAVYLKMRAAYGERFAPLVAESWSDAVDLYARLINPAA